MKHYIPIFIAAALFAAFSCSREIEIDPMEAETGYELLLRTEINGAATRTAADSGQQEDVVESLDVYIYGTFKGDASAKVKGFHLNANNANDYNSGNGTWRVSPDWRSDDLVAGNSYMLYVAANSSKVKTADDAATDNANATQTLAAMEISTLQALSDAIEFDYNPSLTNLQGGHYPFWGANNDDGVNPAWLNVHKKYITAAFPTGQDVNPERYFTHEKTFLMNGTSSSFSPSSTDGPITVTPVTLSRAASKITLEVSFDSGFLTKLNNEKHWTLVGAPQWRFVNFAFNTPIFNDLNQYQSDTYNPKVSVFTSGANLIGYGTSANGNDLIYSNNSFSFSTYTYPVTWTADTEVEEAPAIIISVGYRDDSNTSIDPAERPVTYRAYRIPVVDPNSGIYALTRNKIYSIAATIASEGSTLATDAYNINAAYEIIDWGLPTSSIPVSDRDNSYIDVIPDEITETTNVTDVIIRGNGEHTVRLHVLKPDTKNFSIAYYGTSGATYADPFGQSGTPAPTDYPFSGTYTDEQGKTYACATGAQVPYYINLKGVLRNTLGGSNIQNCFLKDGDDLIIISTALPNKAVKYMKIRVFLDGYKTTAGKYMDVNIRHYPTDYITSYEGQWSSRQSAAVVAGKIQSNKVIAAPEDIWKDRNTWDTDVQFSISKSEYDSWVGFKSYYWATAGWSAYSNAPDDERRILQNYRIDEVYYLSYKNDPNYHFEEYSGTYNGGAFYGQPSGTGSSSINPISEGLSTNYWQAASSEANAKVGVGTDDYPSPTYFWGTDAHPTGSSDNYDYRTTSNNNTIYWLYENRYYKYYETDLYKRKRYYHLNINTDIETWPNWYYDYASTSFKVGAYYNLNTSPSSYMARIITDAKGSGYGLITTNGNTQYRVITQFQNGDTSYSSLYSGDIGDWCAFFGARTGGMTFAASKNNTDAGKNRYMYVLQISESNSQFIIGKPNLGDDNLSEDNVVSPAFMIASQLGSMNGSINGTYSEQWAALHCATYLEVSSDGTYYTGWRLPTEAEIKTMIQYQGNSNGTATLVSGSPVSGDDRVMEPVLTAKYYWALNGSKVPTNYGGQSNDITIRCVRDLTLQEIEALNK